MHEEPPSTRRDPQAADRTDEQAHERGRCAAGERQRRRRRRQLIAADGSRQPQQQTTQRGQAQCPEGRPDVDATVAADAPVEQRADQHQHRRGQQRDHDRRHLPSPAISRASEGFRIHPGFRQRFSGGGAQHHGARPHQIAGAFEPRPQRRRAEARLQRVVGRRERGRRGRRREHVLARDRSQARAVAAGDRLQVNQAQSERRRRHEERRGPGDAVVGDVRRRARPGAGDDRLVVDRDGDFGGQLASGTGLRRQIEQRPPAGVLQTGGEPGGRARIRRHPRRSLGDRADHRGEPLVHVELDPARGRGVGRPEPPQLEPGADGSRQHGQQHATREQPPPANDALAGIDEGHSSSRIPQR